MSGRKLSRSYVERPAEKGAARSKNATAYEARSASKARKGYIALGGASCAVLTLASYGGAGSSPPAATSSPPFSLIAQLIQYRVHQ
jgi:hypothetical protein